MFMKVLIGLVCLFAVQINDIRCLDKIKMVNKRGDYDLLLTLFGGIKLKGYLTTKTIGYLHVITNQRLFL